MTTIQLTLGQSQNKKGTTYFGGYPMMPEKQEIPTCPTCETEMVHLCQIDHSELPFSGLMKSDGISHVFICNTNNCTGFKLDHNIDSTIIQTKNGEPLFKVLNSKCCKILPEKIITKIYPKLLTQVTENYIYADETTTKIVIDIQSIFDLKYTSSKGQSLQLKTITLEDNIDGLQITDLKIASPKLSEPTSSELFLNNSLVDRIIDAPTIFRTKKYTEYPMRKNNNICMNIITVDNNSSSIIKDTNPLNIKNKNDNSSIKKDFLSVVESTNPSDGNENPPNKNNISPIKKDVYKSYSDVLKLALQIPTVNKKSEVIEKTSTIKQNDKEEISPPNEWIMVAKGAKKLN